MHLEASGGTWSGPPYPHAIWAAVESALAPSSIHIDNNKPLRTQGQIHLEASGGIWEHLEAPGVASGVVWDASGGKSTPKASSLGANFPPKTHPKNTKKQLFLAARVSKSVVGRLFGNQFEPVLGVCFCSKSDGRVNKSEVWGVYFRWSPGIISKNF